jgi:outer membrane autotransporter protein
LAAILAEIPDDAVSQYRSYLLAEVWPNIFTAYLSGGRYFRLGQWVIEPHASLLYTDVYEEGFKEDGAGAVSLMVRDSHTKSLVSDVGLRVTRSFETPYGRLIPDAGLFWDYDFGLSDDSITASFAGIPGTEFSIPGEETVHHGARFEAGLSLMGSRGFTTSLKYVGEFRRGNNDQGIFGLLVYEF